MGFIAVPNVSQFQMVFTYDSQRCINTIHVQHVSGWLQANQITVAGVLKDWWNSSIKPIAPPTLSLIQIDYRDLSTYDGVGGTYVTGLPSAGLSSFAQLPNNVTLAVALKTARRGRSYRGRLYHLGLDESEVTGNQVLPGIITQLSDAYGDLMDNVNNVPDCTLVIVSRYSNKTPRLAGVATPVTGITVEPTIDSQRRRLPGRGK